MRVFVAGGTGAVGRALIPRLSAARHTVVAITRDGNRFAPLREAGAGPVLCDVFDRDRLAAVVRDAAPDAIVHQLTDLPATMSPRRLEAIYARNDRVRRDGTCNLLDAGRRAGVRRVVVQSMATWYRPDGGPVKAEQDPLWTDAPEPIGAAVRTLADMEAVVQREAPIAIVLRYGAFYGPGTWYAPDGEIGQRVRKRGFPIVGAGTGIMSFVHVEDAASAVIAALAAPGSGIYNIVDDEPAAASDWLPAYAAALGAPRPPHAPEFLARLVLGKALTAWITSMRGASNRLAAAQLGWTPAFRSWRDGFARML